MGEFYPFAEMKLVYSTASANWATRWGSFIPLQRCSWCILQPQPTGPLVGGVLSLCRDAVGVFYSLSQLGHSLGEFYPFAEMQLVYSTASANWATHWGHLIPLLRCSWCILQPQPTGTLVGGVLPLCWDAVGVFYSLSQLGHSLGNLTPLQRCSQYILQPQLTRPLVGGVLSLCWDAVGVFYSLSQLGHSLGKSYPFAEMQSLYSTAPAN